MAAEDNVEEWIGRIKGQAVTVDKPIWFQHFVESHDVQVACNRRALNVKIII